MSSRRIVASCAIVALVLPLGAWSAVSAFPLVATTTSAMQVATGPGPLERRAHAVTPENPVPRRIHYEEPTVPAIIETASAKVTLKITVDDVGIVAEARPTAIAVKGAGFDIGVEGENVYALIDRQTPSMPPDVAWNARKTVRAVIDSAITSVKAWRYDPPAQAPLTFSISIKYGDAPEEMVFSPKQDNALRVGGAIKPPLKIRDVRPVYPKDARDAGVQGVVIIETRIGPDGSVEEARVIKSIPLLDQAALDAVKQWRFEPTLMNGAPVPIIMTVTINFVAD